MRDVRGLGPKFEASVLEALERAQTHPDERGQPRLLLPQALELGETLARGLSEGEAGKGATVQVAGSARRMADSVKDIDLIAVTPRPVALAKRLGELAEIESVSSTSATGARGRTHSGVGVDLRIGKPTQLGNLLQHFTGSGRHNAALRELAVRQGLHVSEHGVLDDRDGARAPVRPSGRCTSCSGSPTSSRSCARTAASCRRPRWTRRRRRDGT